MNVSILFCAVIVALVTWLLIDVRAAGSDPTSLVDLPPMTKPIFLRSLLGDDSRHEREIAALRRRVRFEHRRVLSEHRRFVAARHRSRVLTRTLRSTPTVTGAISLACTVYGSCSTLRRRAWCESRYDARATNPSGAAGLFQFIDSTWLSTPFGAFSVFDPYANALAAGWMEAHGRGGEWVCR